MEILKLSNFDSFEGRSILSSRLDYNSLLVDLAWEGMDLDKPFELPGGKEVSELVAEGRFADIAEEVWLEVSVKGKADDIIWCTGMAFTVVSRAMAEVLVEAAPEDLDIFPITIRGSGRLHNKYAVVICKGTGVDRAVREFPLGNYASRWLDVSAEVLHTLRSRGFTKYETEDAVEFAQSYAKAQLESSKEPPAPAIGQWSLECSGKKQTLTLIIDSSETNAMFAFPSDLVELPAQLTHNPDGSITSAATGNTPKLKVSRPLAQDSSGTTVNAFWVLDSETLLCVDYWPDSTAFPITVRVALS